MSHNGSIWLVRCPYCHQIVTSTVGDKGEDIINESTRCRHVISLEPQLMAVEFEPDEEFIRSTQCLKPLVTEMMTCLRRGQLQKAKSLCTDLCEILGVDKNSISPF